MQYFKIKSQSVELCGFESYGIMAISSKESKEIFFSVIEEEMYDYVSGWIEEDEDAYCSIDTQEISLEEYEKEKKEFYSSHSVFKCEDGSELIFSTQ